MLCNLKIKTAKFSQSQRNKLIAGCCCSQELFPQVTFTSNLYTQCCKSQNSAGEEYF